MSQTCPGTHPTQVPAMNVCTFTCGQSHGQHLLQ